MGIVQIVIIIFSIAGIGFGAGMHLGVIGDSAIMYKIQNILDNSILSYKNNLLKSAFMSGVAEELIGHAQVSFELGKKVVDPDEEPGTGDEYYDNLITECVFHSDQSFDDNVCIVCKIIDTHGDCVDLFLSFHDFEHGTIIDNDQGFPNTAIPGVTVTAVANTHSGGGKDAVIIFDGDFDGTPVRDPDLMASKDCPGCAGQHILIIAENTDGGADGIVDKPDDNAIGGIMTLVFDEPWFVESVDFVDYDRDTNGSARAFSDAGCSVLLTEIAISNPGGGNGKVQTLFFNTNNVLCLEFEYRDSGGITNINLRCIDKIVNLDNVIAKGIKALPNGYQGSDFVHIPLVEGANIFEAQSVSIGVVKFKIDFNPLSHGADFNQVKSYLLDNFGIVLEAVGFNGIDEVIIYNSFNNGGADPDLEHPLSPNDQDVGKIAILKENSGNQPNDSAAGGIQRYKFLDAATVLSFQFIDKDNGPAGEARAYPNFDCTGTPITAVIPNLGDGSVQTITLNAGKVGCLEIEYEDSGGVTNIDLGCSADKKQEGFFIGGGRVNVPDNYGGTFILTHGFELHCDATQAPNNLEFNWEGNSFHLEELETAQCIDDGTPNEPPPSPHPGPTLDIYTGSGYGRYNGECGAFATWSMDDNGEPGKKDHILSLFIQDKDGNVVLNFNDPLNLKTGNHNFVPHRTSHPNPPTQTNPCPEVTP